MRFKFLVFFLSLSISLMANNAPNKERFMEMLKERNEFVLSEIGLTDAERELLAPVYEEYQNKRAALFSAFPPKFAANAEAEEPELTEEECLKRNERFIENRIKRAELEREYYEKFKKIISAKKIYKMHKKEREYKHRLMQELKDAR